MALPFYLLSAILLLLPRAHDNTERVLTGRHFALLLCIEVIGLIAVAVPEKNLSSFSITACLAITVAYPGGGALGARAPP